LVNWIKHILHEVENCQDPEKFRLLILQDTEEESKKRVVGGDKFDKDWWYMRLINATYLEQVFTCVQ
jgi:hypothetical protein